MGKLFLITGDYIKNSMGMDVIVNAQNKYMGVGGNICGLILQACGKEKLLNYCKENFKEEMYPAEVRITPGFNLSMDIIHVLAPVSYQEKEPLKMIHETYINLINTIKDKCYKKVLCCSLGTGSHKYDPNDIAYDVINILNDFCKNNDVEIYFNNMYPRQKDIYLKEFIKINKIDLSKISDMNSEELINFLITNSICDININENYHDFIEFSNLNELCLSEKIMYLQHVLETSKDEKIINVLKEKIIEENI